MFGFKMTVGIAVRGTPAFGPHFPPPHSVIQAPTLQPSLNSSLCLCSNSVPTLLAFYRFALLSREEIEVSSNGT